ncbi:MAG: multidrug effflux MFS transporter [Candidatus Bathyarchaeia archaeon]|jgi:DHA1 family bicyclomycin/chloramphenicol resistance-like MFS transporter
MKNTPEAKPKTTVRQRHLGDRGLIVLLAVLSAFVPLSTDLYLPALPNMGDFFNVSGDLTNLTLILFFLFFALGILFWGPLSDKYGRRPILLLGLSIYIVASVSCALSANITQLIISRILQASGGSAATAVATAMVKDVYSGRKREAVLSLVQSMVVISPAVAPVLGAFMLPYTSWQGLFWALALIGVASLAGCLMMEETILQRHTGTVLGSMRRLGTVLKNPSFLVLLIIFSLVSTATLAFISSSSYIYQRGFGLSAQWYSFYFAINAVGLIMGPMLYLWLSKSFSRKRIVMLCFVSMIAGGALVCLVGNFGPLVFTFALLPASMMASCARPPGVCYMLEQQKEYTGAASALINSFSLLFASGGMILASMDETNLSLIGAINMGVGFVCFLSWVWVSRRNLIKPE